MAACARDGGGRQPEGVRLRAAVRDAFHGSEGPAPALLLTGLGIALAAAMLMAALVVSDSLGFGFDRAAKAADLPDIIVRFNPQSSSRVAQRITALPDIAGYALRQEVTSVTLQTDDQFAGNGDVEVVAPGRTATRSSRGATCRIASGRWSSSRASPTRGGCSSAAGSTSTA